VIDHGSGIVTKYSNLSTLDLISIGQNIKKGDVISGVGKTALCEIVEEPHLHFEVLKDGKHIDPKNYLPRQSLNR
jgi:murein DD-endopeptidase MepM/ murein hydrolase activator NlpD